MRGRSRVVEVGGWRGKELPEDPRKVTLDDLAEYLRYNPHIDPAVLIRKLLNLIYRLNKQTEQETLDITMLKL